MTDTSLPIPLTGTSPKEQVFPTLTQPQIKRLRLRGHVRPVRRGEVLIEAGDETVPFFVVVAGQIEMIQPSKTQEKIVARHGPGQFTGEISHLTGAPAMFGAIARGDTEVFEISEYAAGLDPEHAKALFPF